MHTFLPVLPGFLMMGPIYLSEFLSSCFPYLYLFPVLTLALLLSLDTHHLQMKPHTVPWGVHLINTWLKTQLKIHLVPETCCGSLDSTLMFSYIEFPVDLQQYYISHLISFKWYSGYSLRIIYYISSARSPCYFRSRIIPFYILIHFLADLV